MTESEYCARPLDRQLKQGEEEKSGVDWPDVFGKSSVGGGDGWRALNLMLRARLATDLFRGPWETDVGSLF